MTMTPAQAAHRKNLLKVIHTGKRTLAMQEDDYRAMLAQTVGKTSAADCTLSELKRVVDALRRLGFMPARGRTARPRVAPENRVILDKIGAILADKQLPWAYAHGIAKKMFGRECVEWLRPPELYKLMQALTVYQRRGAGHDH
jgi:hypothetical protein|nr:MAG TPA: Protein of unknown function (DUF1018) [Caudoviricetes sp.]